MKLNEYWDNIHKKYNSTYDGWLDKYLKLIDKDFNILELGCGRAYATKRLYELGYPNLVATDFSTEVLDIVKQDNPNIKTINFDMSKSFEIDKDSIDVVIADLCLHYFDRKTTKKIINNIYDILHIDGYLIGRVNSTSDKYHIPTGAKKIEDNYYFDGNIYKKFFELEELREIFKDFDIQYLEEEKMDRYDKEKVLIEFCVRKVKHD